MKWTAVGRPLVAGSVAVTVGLATGGSPAHAEDGDTHIVGVGLTRTVDCNNGTLHVNGAENQITALGTCWAVTVQGSGHVVVADTVINDITVYGSNQTVLFHNGNPFLWDRGRELGMTNRLERVPA